MANKLPKNAPEGETSYGGGLVLIVMGESRRWACYYRLEIDGAMKRKRAYLGTIETTPESDARAKMARIKQFANQGLDPRIELEKEEVAKSGKPSFKAFAAEMMAEWLPYLKNEKHRTKWRASLAKHAASLDGLRVDHITTDHILAVLHPIWKKTPVTADEVRARIERILDAAVTKGHRAQGQNPAAWDGHLANLLVRVKRGKVRGSQRAVEFTEVPAVIAKAQRRDEPTARLLELTILTCVRTNEIFQQRVGQIDLANKKWMIPIAQMKVEHKIKTHDIPLSDRAIEILREQFARLTEIYGKLTDDMLVWPGRARGETLSDGALLALLRRLDVDSTTHGFRSCLRTWADDQVYESGPDKGAPKFWDDAVELCLAHVTGSNVKRAYRRGAMFVQRTAIMDAWAAHCAPAATNVVNIKKAA